MAKADCSLIECRLPGAKRSVRLENVFVLNVQRQERRDVLKNP